LVGPTVYATETAKGQVWEVAVTAVAGDLESEAATASVTILNTPPTATLVIEPELPLATEDVGAQVVGSDVDTDEITFTYTWFLGGVVTEYADATLPASATTKGDIWDLTVIPHDGEVDGEPVNASVSIENTVPEVLGVALIPEEAYESSVLSLDVTADDPDGDEISLEIAWYVGGELALEGDQLEVTGELFDKHDRVYATVTASDDFVQSDPVTSNIVTIANSPPTIDEATIDPQEVYEETVATCVTSGWSDDDGDDGLVAISWAIDGAEVSTSETLDGSAFQRGDELTCTAIPTDRDDQGEPVDSSPVTVGNTAPSIDGVSLSSTSPTEADTLTAAVEGATDIDGDEVSFGYAWHVNGTPVSTDASLTGTSFDRGDSIYVEVTPSDGTDDGAGVVSDTAIAVNGAPSVSVITLDPTVPQTEDTITAVAITSDPDGDSVDISWAWYVGGSLVQEGASSSLGAEYFEKSDEVYVVATPSDDSDTGDTLTSDVLTVVNTPPTLSGVTVDPTTVYEDTTVTCQPSGAQDDDDDEVSYSYSWEVNGTAVSTSETLDGASFDHADRLVCTVTPTDGEDDGAGVSSSVVTVSNTPPEISSASLSTTSPTEADTLTVTVTGASDLDGDTVSYLYAWTVDGAGAGTGATLTGARFDKGQQIQVEVTPTDGSDDGDPVMSDVATAVNTPPEVTTITLIPTTVYTDDIVEASVTSSDADGDTVELSYSWTVDGSAVAESGSSLDGTSFFHKGQAIQVEVTPSDGEEVGSPLASSAVEALNSAPTAPTVSVLPAVPEPEEDDLLCELQSESTDADGDSISYSFTWEVDGFAYTGADTTFWSGDTIPAAATGSLETWTCTVTPSDGDDDGTSATASVTTAEACSYPSGSISVSSGPAAGPTWSPTYFSIDAFAVVESSTIYDYEYGGSAYSAYLEFAFYDSRGSYDCSIIYDMDPFTSSLGWTTTSGGTLYDAFDVVMIGGYTDCQALSSRTWGSTDMRDVLAYWDWGVAWGEMVDMWSDLRSAVIASGQDWTNDWAPYVISGYVWTDAWGNDNEVAYAFGYEEECGVLEEDFRGDLTTLSAPTSGPLPDGGWDMSGYWLYYASYLVP